MIDVYVVIGLPGSGKTSYGRYLSEQVGAELFDDCLLDLAAWEKAVAHIAAGHSCVLIDPRFCDTAVFAELNKRLSNIEGVELNIVLRYFKNEPDVCVANASQRDKPVAEWFILHLSKTYCPPEEALPCYRQEPKDVPA